MPVKRLPWRTQSPSNRPRDEPGPAVAAPGSGRCAGPARTCRTTGAPSTPGRASRSEIARADLLSFLFTDQRRSCENYPFGMFAVPRQQVVRVHASSGTTGKMTVVGYTWWATSTVGLLWWRARSAPPAAWGDIVHVGYGYGLFTGGLGAHYGAERAAGDPRWAAARPEKQVQLIEDFGPTSSWSRPATCRVIIEEFEPPGPGSARDVVGRWASSAPNPGPGHARDIEKRRHRRGRHLRPVGGDGARRGQRVHRSKDGP